MKKSKQYHPFTYLLLFFYVWILLEGILRKWFYPGLSTPIFFVKYLIAGTILALFIFNKEKINMRDFPFIGFFLFFLFYCVLQLFNINVTNTPIVGIIGLTVYCGFSIIAFALPKVLLDRESIFKVIDRLSILLVPIFILGIVQFFSPPESIINKYVRDDMYIATVGEHIRITAVFSYIGGYTAFLNLTLLLMFARMLLDAKWNGKSLLLILSFSLGIVNALMTGSRSLVFIFAIQIVMIIIVYTLFARRREVIKIGINIIMAVILGLLIINFTNIGAIAVSDFTHRVENNNDIEHRIYDALNPFKFADQSGFIGYGIGTTYQGSTSFLTQRWRMPSYWEEESERLVIELGVVGFIIVFIFRASVFYFGLKTFFQLKNKSYKLLILVILAHQGPALLIFNQATFNWMENITYWTGVGLLVSVHQINQSEYKRAASTSVSVAAG